MIILAKLVADTVRENFKILSGTVVIIWVVLTFLGTLTLTYRNLTGVFEKLFDVKSFSVLIRNDVSIEERQKVYEFVGKIPGVSELKLLEGSDMKAQLSGSLQELKKELDFLPADFFPSAIVFKIKNWRENTGSELKKVEESPFVETVLNSFQYNRSVSRFFDIVDLFGVFFIFLLLFSLYLITGNSIKLMIFSEIKEIEIFLLFGARSFFILKPVLIQIIGVAVVAYFLAVTTVFFVYRIILKGLDLILSKYKITQLTAFYSFSELLFFGGILVFVCLVGSSIVFYRTLSKLEF